MSTNQANVARTRNANPPHAKNRVVLEPERVIKHFLHGHNNARRFHREIKALRRLEGLDGVPRLLDVSIRARSFSISRIPGKPLVQCETIPDTCFESLRTLVEAMLQQGVARHSLPPRDVILRPDGTAGLVDFERGTLRRWSGITWWVACKVTRFQLLRLIDDHAPHLLNEDERKRLQFQRGIRARLQRLFEWRRRYTPA